MSSKEKKKGIVPKLRFPEFRDAGEWEIRSIEQVTIKVVQGGTPNTSVSEYWNGEIPWITPAEMGDDAMHHYTENTLRAISRLGLENSSAELLPANSVIISTRAPIGYVTINKVEMATNQGCKGLIPNKDIYHEFLYFSLLVAKQRLNDLGAGAGFKEISTSALKTFKIPVPSFPEQQKIADCLSSLDEVIELETKKLEALKAHKKGLMQRLFPREGETTPRLRFPEFRDAGPWEVKRLGEVCDILQGYGFPQRLQGKKFGKYPFYKVSDISNAVINTGGHIREAVNYVDDEDVEELRAKPIPKGSTIFAKIGEALRLNKRAFVEAECLIDNNVVGIKGRNVQAIDYFIFYLSQKIDLNKHCGGAVPSVNKSTLQSIKIVIPSLPEQQKIADCLSSLDEVIELQTKKLEALKAHKKGLMQQLFPQEVG